MNNIIIKAADPESAADILTLNNSLDAETIYRAYAPGERKTTVSEYHNYLSEIKGSTNSIVLIAWDGAYPVGILEAIGGQFSRNAHMIHINIGILKSHWRMGIGRVLFNYLEKWAAENKITRLELSVFSNNEPAIKLYEKMGYKKEGLKTKSFCVDGVYYDEFLMAKLI